jgi:hypothetical protein
MLRYQFFSFFGYVAGRSIKKRRKKWGLPFKENGGDVIAQKWMTS